ncbi:MAG: glycosyltransferase, partial [Acidobacteriota bacterium]|nr:glycosyltransferase [Acidobacteriota bacterium]
MASLLAALSIDIGDHLLPADSHNQLGYFEDTEFLSFHQRVLSQLCDTEEPGHPDWGWTESESLDVSRFSEFRYQAQRLIAARTHKTGPWGWKDPRTALFLDFWDSLLEEARYVLVYRFPWDVADSMQRLEAEVFLRNPEYAYRIWTFYNRKLRDFYQEHSDKCLLVSINALKENVDRFVNLLSDKLGLPNHASRLEEVFQEHLFKTIGGQDPLIDLVAATHPECARLLSELDEMADISGAGLWQARPVRSRLSRPDATDKETIDVTVVTPCYEQGTFLLEAIASAERHAPPRCELIIVNDGSRQPLTLEILDLLKRCGYFVIDQENAGLTAARNKAIGLARGRYILPLDDDNRIRERFLSESIRVLNDAPEIGVVYGDRYDFGQRTGIARVAEFDLDALLDDNYIDACAVFRKQVWIDCHGFDPLMCPLDDWEFWVHAASRGWRFHHIPRVTFDYRVRPGSLISEIRSSGSAEEFRKLISAKHPELYRAKSLQQAAALNQVVADQNDSLHRLRDELAQLRNDVNWLKVERAALVAEISERETRIEMITRSRGWRLVSYYARLKHRFLAPLYRLFRRVPEQTQTRPIRPASEGRI